MRRRKIIFIAGVIFALLLTFSISEAASHKKDFYRNLAARLSKNRDDYKNLSDEEFANFREINTTGIAKNKLYRSSSPINRWGNRNIIADNASRNAGIKTFINLANDSKGMKGFKGFNDTYYSRQEIIGLKLSVKFMSKEFQRGIAHGINFMAENEPPYLIHCDLGKDRAGLFCALIESLMGAKADEIVSDFMVSFYNYFGIEPGTKDYEFVADNEIRPFLASMLGIKSIYDSDLELAAQRYFLKIGVTAENINTLKRKLNPLQ